MEAWKVAVGVDVNNDGAPLVMTSEGVGRFIVRGVLAYSHLSIPYRSRHKVYNGLTFILFPGISDLLTRSGRYLDCVAHQGLQVFCQFRVRDNLSCGSVFCGMVILWVRVGRPILVYSLSIA